MSRVSGSESECMSRTVIQTGKEYMKSIAEIKDEFVQADDAKLSALFEEYANDGRAGVVGLIAQYQRKLEKLATERARLDAMRRYEREYAHCGLVCGIDEAGRGPLAGPVVAGAVILPEDCEILYLNDSKQLSEKRREALFDEIKEKAIAWGIGMASQLLLNDAVKIPGITLPQVPIIKGDAKSLSIAAASVLAKVTRDRLMREYDALMPEYGFAAHKGYGSEAHIEALKKYGPSPIHRRSFIGNFV